MELSRTSATIRAAILTSRLLNAAVANGELSSSADVEALVWHFLGVLQAIMNLPQVGANVYELRRMVGSAMLLWPRAA